MITPADLTDEMIREVRALDLCEVCRCGLLAPQHHNEFMDGAHAHRPFDQGLFVTALHEFDYPSARIEARQTICDAINARARSKETP